MISKDFSPMRYYNEHIGSKTFMRHYQGIGRRGRIIDMGVASSIWDHYWDGMGSVPELAKLYGVAESTVNHIVNGKGRYEVLG